MSDTDELLFEVEDDVGLITFNRPRVRNALTFSMYQRLAEICATPPGKLRAIIISGAGDKAFAAGTDITQFRGFDSVQDAIDYEDRIDQVLTSVESCPLPIIAAIAGACTGGGAGIAAACDIRLASADLKFGFPIARTLGNCLSAASLARLSALLGAGRVREIIFTSRLIEAEEALSTGLITEVLENRQSLSARALEMAHLVATQAPLTLKATKELQRRMTVSAVQDDDLIALCYSSADFQEGIEAFFDKRKPRWKGR
jgi:enoyl-CoA hydratase/carnithine racemase